MGHLTIREADRMVPLLRRIVATARAHHRLIRRATAAGAPSPKTPMTRHGIDLAFCRAEFDRCISELDRLGCVLLDHDLGLVCCRSEVEGHDAFITWRPGQPGFSEWYPVGETHDRRRPLAGTVATAWSG